MDRAKKVLEQLRVKTVEIHHVPESYSSEVYRVVLGSGASVYVKIPFHRDKLYRERNMLERLQGRLPVPKVLDFWEGDESVTGALLLSDRGGALLTGEVSPKLAYEIGCLQARLHAVEMPGFGTVTEAGFVQVENNDWRRYLAQQFEQWRPTCQEMLEPALYERCVEHFDDQIAKLQEPDGPCVVQMDFRPGNLLVHDIDFESARGGSSDIDFTKVNRDIWQTYLHTKESYCRGYESIRPLIDLERAIPFYTFYDAISGVVWCKKRGIENNRFYLQQQITTLRASVL